MKGGSGLVLACSLLLATGTTAACSTPDPAADGMETVSTIALPYLTFLPLHIAAEDGHFAARGLDVKLVRLNRSQDVMAALATGDVDVAPGMVMPNELNLVASGTRIRVVAAMGELSADSCTFAAMATRREIHESGALEDPARLRELRFDVDLLIPFGYWFDLYLRRFALGVDDVRLVDLRGPEALEALQNGSIDVTLDSEPYLSMHASREGTVVVSPMSEVAPGYPVTVIMFGPHLLDERPDLGGRFTSALLAAFRQYREGKTARNLEIAATATGLTAEQLRETCWPAVRADGRVDPGPIRGFQEWLLERGLVERVLADDELYDHRFVRQAAEEIDR